MTQFYKWGDRDRKAQKYDKEKITITKAGKTYNVYDSIQAANIDTDIYEVIQKYHCTESEAVQIMNEKGGEQGVFADIRALQNQIKDIGDIQRVAEEAQNMFEALPAEIKKAAGNNLEDWYNEQKKKAEKAAQAAQEAQAAQTTQEKNGVNNNETK